MGDGGQKLPMGVIKSPIESQSSDGVPKDVTKTLPSSANKGN